MTKKVRLDKFLAGLGYGSRKEVGKGLRRGFLIVDGEEIADNTMHIDPIEFSKKDITYEGQPLEPLSPLVIILNKPKGYVCSHVDDGGDSIFHLLPPLFNMRTPELQIAGRLDKDTTGLVILTDDGTLLHKIISPSNKTQKTYEIELVDPLKGTEKELFESGTLILRNEDKPLAPAQLKTHSDNNKKATLTIHEGRYHQVRRMFAASGNKVKELHRSQIGDLNITDIPPGEHKIITKDELECLILKP